jgi:hypothetical protein
MSVTELLKSQEWKENVPEQWRNPSNATRIENNFYYHKDGEILYYDYCDLFGQIICANPNDHFEKNFHGEKLLLCYLSKKHNQVQKDFETQSRHPGRVVQVGYTSRKMQRSDLIFPESVTTSTPVAPFTPIEEKEEKTINTIKTIDLLRHSEFQHPFILSYDQQQVSQQQAGEKKVWKLGNLDEIMQLFENDYKHISLPYEDDEKSDSLIIIPRQQENNPSIIRFSFILGNDCKIEESFNIPESIEMSKGIKKIIMENQVSGLNFKKMESSSREHRIEELKSESKDYYTEQLDRRSNYSYNFDLPFLDKEQKDANKKRSDEQKIRAQERLDSIEYYHSTKERIRNASITIVNQIISSPS